MPTASETAHREAEGWLRLERWSSALTPELHADRRPTEHDVVVFYDPSEDLARRAQRGHAAEPLEELDSLARFAAALARDESEAWSQDVPDAAMRAFHDRRNLVGDRIVHWAVPWLDAVGRCYPDYREPATEDCLWLLGVADAMRVLPTFAQGEGLTLPGEDAFGPTVTDAPWTQWIRSIWSGRLMLDTTLRSMGLDPDDVPDAAAPDLAILYEVAAARWRRMADQFPGSAGLWGDLETRAMRTASSLEGIVG